MRKTIAMAMIAIMTTVCAQAQKIQTVDREGNPIPLVNVLTEEGVPTKPRGRRNCCRHVRREATNTNIP